MVDSVVNHLAQTHAGSYAHHIVQFMRAVKAAEANETAWDEARRLAQSFMEQIPAKTLKPWRLIVERLDEGRETDEANVPAQLALAERIRTSSQAA